ncbi:MAG: hypothetical protein MZW92_69215 [Comamonadaceae bacterium]|nr:hypothetical protein [Comamonadaceae bacterium]
MKLHLKLLAALMAPVLALGAAQVAAQDIKVGVTVSATGPAASLGIPEKNTFALMPTTIGGQQGAATSSSTTPPTPPRR